MLSCAVWPASLVAVFFIPDHYRSRAIGGMTLVSTIVFSGLKRGDSHAVSQRKELHGIENKTGPDRQRSILATLAAWRAA
jgi:hypothetical protein